MIFWRFRLRGLRDGSVAQVSARPGPDSSWLGIERSVSLHSDPASNPSVDVDLPLTRGVWATIQVTDEATGQPKPAMIEAAVFADNPHARRVLPTIKPLGESITTSPDGRARLLVYPGSGVIAVTGFDPNALLGVGFDQLTGPRQPILPDTLATSPNLLGRNQASTFQAINPPPGSAPITVNLAIRPAQTRAGMVLDPDGQPIRSGVVADNLGIGETVALASERFVVRGLAVGRRRRVLFREDDRARIAVLEVTEPEGPPLVVTLQPWGTVQVEVGDARGQSIAGSLTVTLDLGDGQPKINAGTASRPIPDRITSTAPGRFEVEALAPGIGYNLGFTPDADGQWRVIAHGVRVESGQTLDLGIVRISPPAREAR